MSWSNLVLNDQRRVLEGIRQLASEETSNEVLATAYAEAANELELWLNMDHSDDPFTIWLEAHKEELSSYQGKAVAIHLDKGVVASADADSFWDGSFQSDTSALFKNDPSIYLTIVPLSDKTLVVEAVEQV